MPKVLQKVPSSVAVLYSRVAIEEATGRSLAPNMVHLGCLCGASSGEVSSATRPNTHGAERGEAVGGGAWGRPVGRAGEIQREMPASHCKAKALDS